MTEQKILFVQYCAKDFLDGTLNMDALTELAYRRICDMIYSSNDELLDNDSLQYATKTGSKWKAIRKELIEVHKKLYVENGFLRNVKCTKEIEKSRKNIEQKSEAGQASADKRKSLKDIETTPTAVSTPVPTAVPTNRKPKTKIEEKEVTNVTSKNEIVPRETSVKQKSVALADLTVDHVAEWLAEKRSTGRYRDIDEHALLEKFKDYCLARNPKYRDFVAAFRNSFGWESAPRTGKNNGTHQQKPTYHERIKAAGDAALEQIYADIDAEFGTGESRPAESPDRAELRCVPRLQPPARGDSEHGQGVPAGNGRRDHGGNQPSLPALDAGAFGSSDTG